MKEVLMKIIVFLVIICIIGIGIYYYWESKKESEYMPGVRKVSWPQASEMIKNCEVTGTSQGHNLWVTLALVNGSTVLVKEPAIDEINKFFPTIAACGFGNNNVTE